MDSLSPATCYFIEYWEDLWSGVSSQRDMLTIFNPRVVIRELLDEITLNKIPNKANENFFKRTLGFYLSNDPASKKHLKPYLKLIINEIDLTKHRPRYLPQLCQSALKVFDSSEYFEDCIKSLLELIDSGKLGVNEKSNIRQIINSLIVELREIGYTDEEIREFHKNKMFSNFSYYGFGIVYWEFMPNNICGDLENTDGVEIYQSTLIEKDRVQELLTLAKKEKELIRYIFPVDGLIGENEIEVDGVLFYPPSKKRLVKSNNDPDNDEFFIKELQKYPINAAVFVETISLNSGKIIARTKIEKAFSLLRRTTITKTDNKPLSLNSSCIALNVNGDVIYGASSVENSFINLFDLRDDQFKKQYTEIKSQLPKIETTKKIAETNGWGRRFNEACYWLRKAEESNLYADKLLSYWICIETLCSKSEDNKNWLSTKDGDKETDIFLIREVVGKMRAVNKCYERGNTIYHNIYYRLAILTKNKAINIPRELLEKSQLIVKNNEKIYLKNFVVCSLEIKTYFSNSLLKEQLEELHGFYTNKKTAQEALKTHLQTTQDELAVIYRMRNKIAHDGNSQHPLLPSLCKIAGDYAGFLFNKIVNQVADKQEYELDRILIMAVHEYDVIQMRLEDEEPMNVFLPA